MFSAQVFDDHLELTPIPTDTPSTQIPTNNLIQLRNIIAIRTSFDHKLIEIISAGPTKDQIPTLEKVEISISKEWIESLPDNWSALFTTPTPHKTLSIILNRAAGVSREIGSKIVDFFQIGLLKSYVSCTVYETAGVNDAGYIAEDIMTRGDTQVMIIGGDGTISEFLNGINLSAPKSLEVEIILIPTGTASALYYSQFPPESSLYPQSSDASLLYSLISYLSPTSTRPKRLPVARNSFLNSPDIFTTSVTSTSLHASILYDAEELRTSIPGLDRFKVAAAKNAENWYDGELILSGDTSIYDLQSKKMIRCYDTVKLQGPFSYFISSLVDRFEPTFIVAPLSVTGRINIVLVRPMRSKKIAEEFKSGKTELEIRKEFVGELWKVLGGMYSGGNHIDMVYEDGTSTSMVEYYQCDSFTWKPVESDVLKSNLVCLDGALKDLGRGGQIKSSIESVNISVW